MKRVQNNVLPASALQITFISLSVVLLTLGAAAARNRFAQKPAAAGSAPPTVQRQISVAESSGSAKKMEPRKAERVEFLASRQRVGGREIAGFSTRQTQAAQEQNLTSPGGLKPVEQEAWLAMARRQGANGGIELASFYPKRYGEAFVVEGEGVRVAVRPMGGTNVTAQIDNGQVIYREAYLETNSVHVVGGGRSEEFLYLQSECAPREFAYEISEMSAGTRVELVKGEVLFRNNTGHGVKIEAPWLIEATGERRAGAVRWELEQNKSGALPGLRLIVAAGLRYPLVIDPSWTATGSLGVARDRHTATLLPNGKVLVVGGQEGPISILSSAELYDPGTGRWSSTGNLRTARASHTATLLSNGKVLIAGGYRWFINPPIRRFEVLQSAEVYDPATGTWSVTGPLYDTRYSHTATLLLSGKVLVAGGQHRDGVQNSAEVYDPAAGTWTNTGCFPEFPHCRFFHMTEQRSQHTATLLRNGKVLIAGGGNRSQLSSAELFDPSANDGRGGWAATGNLGTARLQHTATLLPNGKVLVAGGSNLFIYLPSAELYDPATGSWSYTGNLGAGRDGHTATLLPTGKVLLAGGRNYLGRLSSAELYDSATESWSYTSDVGTARSLHTATLLPSGQVLIAGGSDSRSWFSSAEVYDPTAATWTTTGRLTDARELHTATLMPNGKVLVTGGRGYRAFFNSAEVYDPAAATWTATDRLTDIRSLHTATLLSNGQVLVAGGTSGSLFTGRLKSAEVYDPAAGTWTVTGSLTNARAGHRATLLPSGQVLVTGGLGDSGFLRSSELYDPEFRRWVFTQSLRTARFEHTMTLLPNGKVLAAGGSFMGPFDSAEVYDPETRTWSRTIGSPSTARYGHTATLLPNGKVLVAGGVDRVTSTTLSSAELYDPAAGTWSITGSLAAARAQHTATLLPNGKVLVAGGVLGDRPVLSSAELYDPATGSWSSTASLVAARRSHTATLLPSGQVLVAAGRGILNDIDFLSSSELYNSGLGFDPNWRPLLTAISPSTLRDGTALTASGSRFKGMSEASGGNGTQNSSSNYPLVQLLSLVNEQTLFLSLDATKGWSDTSFTSRPVNDFPGGYALVTVFTNGIPSQSHFVVSEPRMPTPPPRP